MNNKNSRSGHYEKFGEHNHFVPSSLPPIPLLQMDNEMIILFGEAMRSLGKLNEVGVRIPNKRKLIDIYVAKEAVLSSDIEGIHTTLTEVLEYKARQKLHENKNIEDVLNYMDAVNHAVNMLEEQGLPISSRVIRESHEVLLAGARGKDKMPGNFRKVPVFVGSLVPPPANYIADLITDLEKFINEDKSLPPLINVGLAHVQFETIHPFLDGNGRIGRLLIVLMMMDYGLISEPILYPSSYFKKFHSEYYERLDRVRTHGDYEGWINYFLRGVKHSAEDVVARAWQIDKLLEESAAKIEANINTAKRENALRLLEQLCHTPTMSISDIAELTETTYPPAQKLTKDFEKLGILEPENPEKKRGKTYSFKQYLKILERA